MPSRRRAPGVRYSALLQLLSTAESLWNASRTFFAPWKLSPSQFNILNLLNGTPEGLSQIELSRRLITHRSNITGLVDRLEDRQLVRRLEEASDRRAYRVVLTAHGQRLVAQILPLYYRAAEAVWGDIPDAQARQLARQLEKIGAAAARMRDQSKQVP